MTKMASIIMYAKNLKKKALLFQNHWIYCFETLYVELGDRVLPSLFKWWL